MRLLSTVILVLLTSCAGSPGPISKMDAEELAQVAIVYLCYSYSSSEKHDVKIRPELERRNIFTEREWAAIDQHKIFIGMSALAFQCSWGEPDIFESLLNLRRTKEGPWGLRVMHHYSDVGDPYAIRFPSCTTPYAVYIENDTVVAFQEHKIRHSWGTKWYEDWKSLVTTVDSNCLLQP